MAYDPKHEQALVYSLAYRLALHGDPRYRGGLYEAAYRGLQSLLDNEVVVVYIDAGSRTLEIPASPVSVVKLAEYRVDYSKTPPETGLYYKLYKWRSGSHEKASNLLYARGGYRVRQALSFLVEITGLYTSLRELVVEGRTVIGLKDGPLAQQVAQYLNPYYNIDENTALYALRYAGFTKEYENKTGDRAEELVRNARVKINNAWSVNPGILILEILDLISKLPRNRALAAGVVENTSRSSSLIAYLIAELVVETLRGEQPGKIDPDSLLKWTAKKIDSNFSDMFFKVKFDVIASDCLCEKGSELLNTMIGNTLFHAYQGVLDRATKYLAHQGHVPGGLAVLHEMAHKSPDEAMRLLIRALVLSQTIANSLVARDPDLVMTSYYLGLLSVPVTKLLPRLGPYESAMDAIGSIASKSSLGRDRLEGLASRLRGLRMRYMITDPPMRCGEIAARLSGMGVRGTLRPCMVSALDSYAYAPPVRLEVFGDPNGMVADLVAFESVVSRYKFPHGILIVDKASRVSLEEALTARPLEKRLVPLRYYIRSWEKRIEHV